MTSTVIMALIASFHRAEVAELADAHGSGPCTRKGVGVRVPSSAPKTFRPCVSYRIRRAFCFVPNSCLKMKSAEFREYSAAPTQL